MAEGTEIVSGSIQALRDLQDGAPVRRDRDATLAEMREAIVQAAGTVRANPLRSSLGALAIAVAVATIICVNTALDGIRRYAEQTTARTFGSNTFLIAQVASPGRVSRRELREQLERNPPISRLDAAQLTRLAGGRTHLRAERAGAGRRGARQPARRGRLDHRHHVIALGDSRSEPGGRPLLRARRGRRRRARWR